MIVEPTGLSGLLLLRPVVHGDDRGFFLEAWNRASFDEAVGESIEFVQDNVSRSGRGVVRGLHYQVPPHAQGKLVWVVQGTIWDVAVDFRRGSPTFGHHYGVELSEAERTSLWIPPGFAHGFLVVSDHADVTYKVAGAYYAPESERAVRWDDPDLAIPWPIEVDPIVSEKDTHARSFAEADVFEA